MPHLVVQVKTLALPLHICFIQVVHCKWRHEGKMSVRCHCVRAHAGHQMPLSGAHAGRRPIKPSKTSIGNDAKRWLRGCPVT